MREIVRHVQAARKDAGLSVDDRINLSLSTSDELLKQAIQEHETAIMTETLAETISKQTFAYDKTVNVEGVSLAVSLEKLA
jgi:isoleucyl-tRNA synthetase